jgi:hypothetical protein
MKRSVGLNVISRRGPDPNGVPRSPAKHTVKIEKSLRLRQQLVTPSIDCAGFLFAGGIRPTRDRDHFRKAKL